MSIEPPIVYLGVQEPECIQGVRAPFLEIESCS